MLSEYRLAFQKAYNWENLLYLDDTTTLALTEHRENAKVFESQKDLELYVLNNYTIILNLCKSNDRYITIEKIEPTYPMVTSAFTGFDKELSEGKRNTVTEKEYDEFKKK